MEIHEPLRFSNSFKRLLNKEFAHCRPIQLIYAAVQRMNGKYHWKYDGMGLAEYQVRRGKTRLLNPRMMGNCFSFREKKGLVSFMPRGKQQHINSFGKWAREGRQSMKPASWLRSMLNPRVIRFLKIKDDEFAIFATAMKHEELKDEISFKFVSFSEGYNSSNYGESSGCGIESCMWDNPVEEFYDLFKAKCLVCVDGTGRYHGRAVVWFGVELLEDGSSEKEIITFMDRIYADSEEVKMAFQKHAKKKKWWQKWKQSADSREYFMAPDGSERWGKLSVETTSGEIAADFYPYMDTFRFGSLTKQRNHWVGDGDWEYGSTDGDRHGKDEDEHEGEVEDVDGTWISYEDSVEIEGDYYRYDDHRVVRMSNGDYELRRRCREVTGGDYRGEWHLRDDVVYLGGDYWHVDDGNVVYVEDGEYMLMEDAVEVNDTWYNPNGGLVRKNEDDEWEVVVSMPQNVNPGEGQQALPFTATE